MGGRVAQNWELEEKVQALEEGLDKSGAERSRAICELEKQLADGASAQAALQAAAGKVRNTWQRPRAGVGGVCADGPIAWCAVLGRGGSVGG